MIELKPGEVRNIGFLYDPEIMQEIGDVFRDAFHRMLVENGDKVLGRFRYFPNFSTASPLELHMAELPIDVQTSSYLDTLNYALHSAVRVDNFDGNLDPIPRNYHEALINDIRVPVLGWHIDQKPHFRVMTNLGRTLVTARAAIDGGWSSDDMKMMPDPDREPAAYETIEIEPGASYAFNNLINFEEVTAWRPHAGGVESGRMLLQQTLARERLGEEDEFVIGPAGATVYLDQEVLSDSLLAA